MDILRTAEHITEPRWTWIRSTDWNAAMTPFAPHFALLAAWITSICTTASCDDRNQSQALINCLCYIWYGFALGAITNCGKWKSHDYGRRVQPWWNKECHDAAVRWSRSFRSADDSIRRSAAQHYKRTIQLACRRTVTQTKHIPTQSKPNKTRSSTQRDIHEPLPPTHTRNPAKLAIIDPVTGNTVYGQQALDLWRNFMMQHLTDTTTLNKSNTPCIVAQPAIADFEGEHHMDTDEEADEEHCLTGNSSPTLSDGSGTSYEMHTRRIRMGPGRQSLLAENSSGDDINAFTTATQTPPTSATTSLPSSPRQSTLPEYFSEKQFGFDTSFHCGS